MADSAQARFTTFEVPGLMMTPIPHSMTTSADRSQLNDVYAGIDAQLVRLRSETCWTPLSSKRTTWSNSSLAASTWVAEKKKTLYMGRRKGCDPMPGLTNGI